MQGMGRQNQMRWHSWEVLVSKRVGENGEYQPG